MHLRLPLLSILILTTLPAFTQKSYIQVKADPGISIFLDGDFKGITNAELGGLILQDIQPGRHIIKAVKEGFQAQEKSLDLKPGQVQEFTVSPFIPKVSISQSGESENQSIELKTGTLIIQSLPISIDISIPAQGITSKKRQDKWTADGLAVGKYQAYLSTDTSKFSCEIVIEQNQTTHLFANLINHNLEDRVSGEKTNLVPVNVKAGSTGQGEISRSSPPGKVQFTATAPAQVPRGSQFKLTVEGNARGTIDFPETSFVDVIKGPATNISQSLQQVNGKMTSRTQVVYSYFLQINAPGRYPFPPIKIRVGDDEYLVEGLVIEVE